MKLCPQCEFLYEDDQVFCDMDGESLVHDGRSEAFSDAAAAVIAASPKHSRRRIIVVTMIAGVLLLALLSFVYYASSHSFDSDLASRSRQSEANLSQQKAVAPVDNSTTQPAVGSSQSLPAQPSESPSVSVVEPAQQPDSAAIQTTSQTTRAKDNSLNANDSRLMISKQVPPLPQLNPLPRLLPPQRLSAAKPTAISAASRISGKQKGITQTTTATSQKSLIVEVKPASRNATKRAKVGAFFIKTGRMLTKPFKR